MTLHPPDLVAWSAWKVLVIVVDAIAVIVGTLGGVAGISSARCSFPRLMELRAIRLRIVLAPALPSSCIARMPRFALSR